MDLLGRCSRSPLSAERDYCGAWSKRTISGALYPKNGCDTEDPPSLASYEDKVVGPVRYRGCEESTGLTTGGFTFALFLFLSHSSSSIDTVLESEQHECIHLSNLQESSMS